MNILKRFKKKRIIPEEPAVTNESDLRQDILNPEKLWSGLNKDIFLSKIVKPFYRISSKDSYVVFDIYPKFKLAKRKNILQEFYFKDEEELANIVNAYYETERKRFEEK